MRLKYYKKTLRQMRVNKAFVFTSILITLILSIGIYMYNKAIPVITTLSESSAKSIALKITNDAVKENIENITYDKLVSMKQDEKGNIVSLSINAVDLNKLSTSISSKVSEKLMEESDRYIKLPVSTLFGLGFLSGYGPKLPLSVIPSGNVNTKFNSEFKEAGINQIKHKIYLTITTRVRLIAPFYTSSQEYVNDLTIAETIIVGGIPSSYYNIHGIEDLNKDSTLNLFGN
ncbi:MAG: sporulation protein YunB [Clostridia bacterium]